MSTPLRLIAGLGNPGPAYEDTRHNAGFWYVDRLAAAHGGQFRPESRFNAELCRIRLADHELWLVKPQTYMNRSGQAVQAVARYYKLAPADILVAHDDLDLPPGTVRLKRGGGHGGHNGLRDLIGHLGKDFLRLRIGIGHPGHKDQVHDYVLSRPSRTDRERMEAAIERAVAATPLLLEQGLERAMNTLHSEP